MASRDVAKQAVLDSLDQVRALIAADALGDAITLGYRLGAQIEGLMVYDDAEAKLIVDQTERDQALASLRARNYPSEGTTA